MLLTYLFTNIFLCTACLVVMSLSYYTFKTLISSMKSCTSHWYVYAALTAAAIIAVYKWNIVPPRKKMVYQLIWFFHSKSVSCFNYLCFFIYLCYIEYHNNILRWYMIIWYAYVVFHFIGKFMWIISVQFGLRHFLLCIFISLLHILFILS